MKQRPTLTKVPSTSSMVAKSTKLASSPKSKKVAEKVYTVEELKEKIREQRRVMKMLLLEKDVIGDVEKHFVPVLLSHGDKNELEALAKIRNEREQMDKKKTVDYYIEGIEDDLDDVELLKGVHKELEQKIAALACDVTSMDKNISHVHDNFSKAEFIQFSEHDEINVLEL